MKERRNGFIKRFTCIGIGTTSLMLIGHGIVRAGNYGDIYGASSQGAAMGNALTAYVRDASAAFYNVAGLGQLNTGDLIMAEVDAREKGVPFRSGLDTSSGPIWQNLFTKDLLRKQEQHRIKKITTELSLTYHYVRPKITTDLPSNLESEIDAGSDSYLALGLSFNFNALFDTERNIRFGIQALLPATGPLLTIYDVDPVRHRLMRNGVSNEKPAVLAGLGVEVLPDMLFLGAGINAGFTGTGTMLMNNVPVENNPVIPEQQVILELKPKLSPTAGVMFRYGRFITGLSYRGETKLQIDKLNARAQTLLMGIEMDLTVAMLDQYSPQVFSGGIGYQLLQNAVITFDVNRELWSKYDISYAKKQYSEPVKLSDITVLRAGVEYGLMDSIKLRGGYSFIPSIISNMSGANNLMDNRKHVLSLGGSYWLYPQVKGPLAFVKRPIVFDIVFQYQILSAEKVVKDNPTDENPSYSYKGNAIMAGLSVSQYF